MQTALAQTVPFLREFPVVRPDADTIPMGVTQMFDKEEEIFAEGDRATCFYKVVSGAIRTSKLLSDGRRQIDAFHLAGDFFGIEVGREHRFSAEALGRATVIAYRRTALDALGNGRGEFSRQIIASMMHSLERAQAHMMLLGRKTALERIATFLLDLAERLDDDHLDMMMSRIDIADHLGLTIETVSRTLTQLERKGIIEVVGHRRTIVLQDKDALRNLDS